MSRELTGRTALGYGLVVAAVTMFSLNASLALFLLDDGLSAMRLSELRTVGALVLLVLIVIAVRPAGLAIDRREVPAFAVLGIAGLAVVYVTYFVAIERLGVGPGLTLEYLAPLLILLWLRVAHGRRLSPSLWAAVALSFAGSVLVVRAYEPSSLDALGVLAGLGAAVSFAIYFLGSERAGTPPPAARHAVLGVRVRDRVLARDPATLDVPVRAARLGRGRAARRRGRRDRHAGARSA